jgi:ferredoxin-NADP reductase
MKQVENKCIYVVEKNIKETHDVSTLETHVLNEKMPQYCAGQYITVYFPQSGTPEGKAYSISNPPGTKTLNITVKAMGEFSRKLTALRPGDMITGSLPYGYFYSESTTTPLVLIAAGIGIAPFRSIIGDALSKDPKRSITLFYSSKTSDDVLFKEELDEFMTLYPNFKVIYFLTRETVHHKNIVCTRISKENFLAHAKIVEDAEYMICGSISFTRDMWKMLRSVGILEEKIYTEAFFSH